MRLPWLQIDADGMTRGEMLGRLLCVGADGGIGLALRLWRWALEMSPDGDFSGGKHDAQALAAGIGWDPKDAETLVAELIRVGLAAQVDLAGSLPVFWKTVRIKGLERYQRAWEKNNRRKPALRVPVTGTNPRLTGAEPAPKTETETETETDKEKQKPAGEKPPAVRIRKPKTETSPDHRHAPLVAALATTFEAERHTAIAFDGYQARAVTQLLAIAEPAEIDVRYRRALRHQGFPTVATPAELRKWWDHFAAIAPKSSKGPVDPSTQIHAQGQIAL